MTDTIAAPRSVSSVPESIRTAIEALWRLSMSSEKRAKGSRAFRVLEDTCRSVYLGLEGSRLAGSPSVNVTPSVLNRALQNFFRWNGAPWFKGESPDAGETAAALHGAFLRQSVRRTYLVPLDRLCLEDRSSGTTREVTSARFGPNEVVRLNHDELARRVSVEALPRFGARYRFPVDALDGFCWLATGCTEPAGPLERRTWLNVLGTALADVGTVGLFRSAFPVSVENALFVLLLVLLKNPEDPPWQPFRVPWILSVTDDMFSDADTPPDAAALSLKIVGDEYDHFEVPDDSEAFDFGAVRRESLERRWNDLEAMLARAAPDTASFHPLTKRFFVKALREHGVDEILANLSCLEATLQRKGERGRPAVKRRFKRLVRHAAANQWLKEAYRSRDDYLHSVGDSDRRLSWSHLARTRWAVATAVGKYLDFAVERPGCNRSELLKQLSL